MSAACPSGKIRHRDKLAARTAYALMPDKDRRREIRVYRCPLCKGWHLTSKPGKK